MYLTKYEFGAVHLTVRKDLHRLFLHRKMIRSLLRFEQPILDEVADAAFE